MKNKMIENMNIKRYCLALDLVNDAQMIEQYEKYHETPRPEILKSIHDSGITLMEIYRIGNRLVYDYGNG